MVLMSDCFSATTWLALQNSEFSPTAEYGTPFSRPMRNGVGAVALMSIAPAIIASRPSLPSANFRASTPSPSTSSRNMRLLGHHPLNGFGNCGEGLALQKTRDGRRVLWVAHESQPKNVTAIDVTNPKKPVLITQTDLPHEKMRSNSLDLVGDLLIVAYQP